MPDATDANKGDLENHKEEINENSFELILDKKIKCNFMEWFFKEKKKSLLKGIEDIYEYKIYNDGYLLRKLRGKNSIKDSEKEDLENILEKSDINKDNFDEVLISFKLMA